MPDWTKPFILDTNACEVGIRAVLFQCDPDGSEHVIAYASRLFTRPKRNYCVTRKELLAVVTFLNHFRHYLIGTPFTIQTDHGALTWLQHFKSPEGQLARWLEKLARWLEKLQAYQFSIINRPGHQHNNPDALSRVPCQQCERSDTQSVTTVTSANTVGGFTLEEMRILQLDDTIIGKLLRAKETNYKPTDAYTKSQGNEYRYLASSGIS